MRQLNKRTIRPRKIKLSGLNQISALTDKNEKDGYQNYSIDVLVTVLVKVFLEKEQKKGILKFFNSRIHIHI